MDFQFFEIQFFEKNHETTMNNYEKTMKNHLYKTSGCLARSLYKRVGDKGGINLREFVKLPASMAARAPWGPKAASWGPKKGPKERNPKKGDHIHWWTINEFIDGNPLIFIDGNPLIFIGGVHQ